VGQTRTSSLGAARPLPPSAEIGPGGAVRWSSCAILFSAKARGGRLRRGSPLAQKENPGAARRRSDSTTAASVS